MRRKSASAWWKAMRAFCTASPEASPPEERRNRPCPALTVELVMTRPSTKVTTPAIGADTTDSSLCEAYISPPQRSVSRNGPRFTSCTSKSVRAACSAGKTISSGFSAPVSGVPCVWPSRPWDSSAPWAVSDGQGVPSGWSCTCPFSAACCAADVSSFVAVRPAQP